LFGQLLRPENITPQTFAEVAAFDTDTWYKDKSIELDNAEHWFQVDVLGIKEPPPHKEPWTDVKLTQKIRELSASHKRIQGLLADNPNEGSKYSVADEILYKAGRIEVPKDPKLRRQILKSRHDSRLAGHPGQAKTMSLVCRCFQWPGMKKIVNRYVDGCESCQQTNPSTQHPFGLLKPLPIPAGLWNDISYNMITDLPLSKGYNSILKVVNCLTKMAHFLPCNKSMNAERLADLMLKEVWKLHGTPKMIVSDRGSIFVSQINKELNKRLGIKLLPLTAYQPRTNGQSEITNKVVEQYLQHFSQYQKDNWATLLVTAKFVYNNADHASTGTSPFRANYRYEPTYGGILLPDQCVPAVLSRLSQLEEVQSELQYCLEAAQEAMKRQFNKGTAATPNWKVGKEVWLSSKNISTTRPSPKLAHRWMGPFPIAAKISQSVYKLTLPVSMKAIHPVFHISILKKYTPDNAKRGRNRWW
jgi:hypothetical protein